ncbi:MAG: hypothetical protein ACYS9C_16360 [Planctomycetota bacterium]|jgi:hypothetical protein
MRKKTISLFLWPFVALWKLLLLALIIREQDVRHNIGGAIDDCRSKNRGVIRYVDNIDSVEF